MTQLWKSPTVPFTELSGSGRRLTLEQTNLEVKVIGGHLGGCLPYTLCTRPSSDTTVLPDSLMTRASGPFGLVWPSCQGLELLQV